MSKLLAEYINDFYRKLDTANTDFCGTFPVVVPYTGTAVSLSVGRSSQPARILTGTSSAETKKNNNEAPPWGIKAL